MNPTLFDTLAFDDVLSGLEDLEARVEQARDDVDDVLDVVTDQDEVAGKNLDACVDAAGSARQHLTRILEVVRKTIARLKLSSH